MLSELVGGLVDDIVRDGNGRVLLRRHVLLGHITAEPVERVLKGVPGVLLVVIGIELEVDDVVTHVLHKLLTSRFGGAARERWANVGGDLSDNVVERHLEVDDLVFAGIRIDLRQVEMRPCVRGDLMSLRIHTLDHVDELLGLVNLSLSDVVSGNEEGSLCVVLLEEIQDSCGGILHRPVIISNSNMAGIFASPETAVDAVASIRDRTNFRTGDRVGALAIRLLVLRTPRTVFVLAIGGVTVTGVGAAVSQG